MALETSYLNLIRGNRLASYMGLVLAEGVEPKYAQDYGYVEVPLAGFEKDGELVQDVKRNQYVKIVPACTVDVRGNYRAEVHANPAIAEFGMVQPGYYIEPGSGKQVPCFWFQARKDVTAGELGYAIRIFLRA